MSKKQKNKATSFSLPKSAVNDAAVNFALPANETSKRLYFSHRFICTRDFCIKKCSYEQFKSLADKLRILSELEWKIIKSSPRETNGYEEIPVKQINGTLPNNFSNLDSVMIFRFGGGSRGGRIVGTLEENRFYILFIDSKYNLYDHGS